MRTLCLALVSLSLAHAQEPVATEVRAALDPPAPVALDQILFGPCNHGVTIGPAESVRIDLGGREVELSSEGAELVLGSAGLKKPLRARKDETFELATPGGLARLRCVPFRAPIAGPFSIETVGSAPLRWNAHRLDGRAVRFPDRPSLVLLDANLNGLFTDVGVDLVLQGNERIVYRLPRSLFLADRWWSVRASATGEELFLEPLEPKLGELAIAGASELPAPLQRVVVVSESGDDALLVASKQPWRLPPGSYRLRHALCGEQFEFLAPDTDPSSRGMFRRDASQEPWCSVTIEQRARPSLGAPYRLHPFGSGFRDPEDPARAPFAASGGRAVFHLHGVLIRGRAGEIWDVPRAGATARLEGLSSFAEQAVRIGTTQQDGKAGKAETWSFAKQRSYAAPSTVTERAASFWVELERKPFGKLRAELLLGKR